MPGLSSTTLFNYTDSYRYLIDNLRHGIHCGYTIEKLHRRVRYRVAMTCFCDIPLSMVKDHFEWYGQYGIGINKKYALTNNVMPVWYTTNRNPIVKFVGTAAGTIAHAQESVDILKYTKGHYGRQMDVNGVIRKKKFYDEKEWRFTHEDSRFHLNHEIDDHALPMQRLRFPLSDTLEEIEYIIISETAELSKTISYLRRIATRLRISPDLLISKILIAENIKRDF